VVERAIPVVLDLQGESVEVYNIPCNAVSILHLEMLELIDGVVRSKGTLELSNEMDPTDHSVDGQPDHRS